MQFKAVEQGNRGLQTIRSRVRLVHPPTGASVWRTRPNITSFDWPHYMKIWRHPQNRKYRTYCIDVRWMSSHCRR